MRLRSLLPVFFAILLCVGIMEAQLDPYNFWTLLPAEQMAEIIGEASGETAFNTIMETGGYNKNRLDPEYQTRSMRPSISLTSSNSTDCPGAEIVRYPGREVWDGIEGELWEVKAQAAEDRFLSRYDGHAGQRQQFCRCHRRTGLGRSRN